MNWFNKTQGVPPDVVNVPPMPSVVKPLKEQKPSIKETKETDYFIKNLSDFDIFGDNLGFGIIKDRQAAEREVVLNKQMILRFRRFESPGTDPRCTTCILMFDEFDILMFEGSSIKDRKNKDYWIGYSEDIPDFIVKITNSVIKLYNQKHRERANKVKISANDAENLMIKEAGEL